MDEKNHIIYLIDGAICEDEKLLNDFISQEYEKQ